ncbi:MAG TPA: potassium channel protein [Thermoguttaceae bacterium]|nr:potassium channel protein [Thermoguttaceae bacterium]
MSNTPPLKRLQVGLAILAVIFVVAVCGYRLGGWSLLDSIYMTVTTLSMVGYRDDFGATGMTPALQVFTIVLIVFGVSAVLYILGGLFQMMTEGEINRALGLRRVSREVERLSDHVVVCGFGRMGEILAGELKRGTRPFVVIDNDPERIAAAISLGYLALTDNATEEEALIHANVQRAKTLVITLPTDAENVFITLTARNLNPDLQIVARAELPTTEKKLLQAGANRVVLPAAAAALRMAAMITRPSTVELIELVAGHHVTEVQVDELTITPDSRLVDCTVRDSETRSRHGLLIVALRHPGGDLMFNPGADTVFQGGDTVIVMGQRADIERFRAEYGI